MMATNQVRADAKLLSRLPFEDTQAADLDMATEAARLLDGDVLNLEIVRVGRATELR